MYRIIIAIFLCSVGLSAQEDTSVVMDDIQVVGTRIKQHISKVNRDIRVIDRKEILASGVRSLDEAFQLLGGVEVQTRGPFGTQADINMRGSTFNQVLVLVDGQAINDPLTGHFSSNIPVTMAEVSRIEVIRGPSAAIYGPNAVGGVINIITSFGEPESMSFSLKGHYNTGDFDLQQYGFGGEMPWGKLRLSAHHSKSTADGPQHFMDTSGSTQFLDIETTTFGVAWLPTDDFLVSVKTGFDDRDFDARNYYTRSSADRSVEQVQRKWVQGRVKAEVMSSTIELNTSFSETDDNFDFLPGIVPQNLHNTTILDHRLEWKRSWGQLKTNVGGQIQYRTIESNDRGSHAENQVGIFALGIYEWNDKLTTELSLRMDHQEVYDWKFIPQIGVNYRWSNWKLNGLVGKSVRAGDFTERFIGFGRTTLLSPGRNLGNPNLQTEEAWTAEAGIGYLGWSNMEFGLNVFYRQSSDLIDFVLTPYGEISDNRLLDENGSYFYTRNISELSTLGLELFGRHTWNLSNKIKWTNEINISIIQSDNSDENVSKYLANHAGVFGSFSSNWTLGKWSINLNGIYKNRDFQEALDINAELTDQYFILNGRLNLRLLSWINLYGQVHNITDQEYSDILGARMPGSWWSAGVRVGF